MAEEALVEEMVADVSCWRRKKKKLVEEREREASCGCLCHQQDGLDEEEVVW